MASTFALFAPRVRSPIGAAAAGRPASRPRPLAFGTAARWAVVVALCMSTQYLFQPFVWKHWPVADVLAGWLEIARDRVLVAVLIAATVAGATRLPVRGLPARTALLALSIVVGAAAGELALLAFGSPDARRDVASVLGRVFQWLGLALCVAATFYLWLRESEVRAAARAQELRRSTAEALLVQTQLQALRQQIEPHFLFNTLATIRRLEETGPAEGSRALHHLVAYLRSTMPSSAPRTTLGEEVDLVASYLAIVAIRMSGRLTVSVDVADALRAGECPPLTLATLVENAVKHGITPSPGGGEIAVRARRDGDVLEIVVADTGVGLSAAGSAAVGGTGIGLANIRARLRALYGSAATLTISGQEPRGARATIRLPWRERHR